MRTMYSNFEEYIWGAIGTEGGEIPKYIRNVSDELIQMTKRPNNTEIMKIEPQLLNSNKIVEYIPKFMLIQYNYNGNKLWVPILALGFKNQNNIPYLFAINLEYLAPRYKILLFDKIFRVYQRELGIIAEKEFVKNEITIKDFKYDAFLKILSKDGMDYALRAPFKINKIVQSYIISVKIIPNILFADMKRYNSGNMKDLYEKISGEEQINLGEIIKQYDKLIENYQEDSLQYHKDVALFREKLKLFSGKE